jgi:hypothetical protein
MRIDDWIGFLMEDEIEIDKWNSIREKTMTTKIDGAK